MLKSETLFNQTKQILKKRSDLLALISLSKVQEEFLSELILEVMKLFEVVFTRSDVKNLLFLQRRNLFIDHLSAELQKYQQLIHIF